MPSKPRPGENLLLGWRLQRSSRRGRLRFAVDVLHHLPKMIPHIEIKGRLV
jgi:hypothetical protein